MELAYLFKDLSYAFCRHATSKIETFQDLYRLESFGFRGEALASIAAVAQVTCFGRCQGEEGGQISLFDGQAQTPIRQKDLPHGTHLIIKNLFFNTPVRLNFVKSQITEKKSLLRILNAFLISHPEVEFHLKWDRKEKQIFSATDNRFLRFIQSLSANRWDKNDFHFVEKQYDGYSLSGFYNKTAKKSGQTKNQYLFVNKRLIQDRALHHTISSALEGYWSPGMSGPYLFELEVPLDHVDVNIHPNKTMVKFINHSVIHSLFYSTLKESCSSLLNQEALSSSQNFPPGTTSHYSKDSSQYNVSSDLKKSTFQSYEQRTDGALSALSIDYRYKIITTENDGPLLVDSMILIKFYLDSIKTNLHCEGQVPLMVGIPFRGQETVRKILTYKYWERDHFEFDSLTDDLVILRSIPHCLIPLPHSAAVFYLLNQQELFEREIKKESLSPHTIKDLIEKFSLEQLANSKVVVVLKADRVAKYFQ